jgi:hypothetical protein
MYWSDTNNIEQRIAFKNLVKKYLFDCISGHEFESQLDNISQGKMV